MKNFQIYLKHLRSITRTYAEVSFGSQISDGEAYGIIARSISAAQKICGEDSPYSKQITFLSALDTAALSYKTESIIGVIKALIADIEDGYLENISEMVRGEMFDDFTDMALHLLNEGYKDAAAVIAGSSLEIHLRQLCDKEGIPTTITAANGDTRHKKAEQLNQELGKSAYSLFDQKQITAWLDLRNSAAHGKYTNYTGNQVEQLIEWVKDFITRTPA